MDNIQHYIVYLIIQFTALVLDSTVLEKSREAAQTPAMLSVG